MDMFDAPIPGQSLTGQPGGMAMERPPQFTDPNQALEFLFQRLTREEFVKQLVVMLKAGSTVEYIVRTILFEGVIKGRWTPDVALLMAQTVTWMVESVAKLKGVKAELKNPNRSHDDFMANFVNLLEKPTASEPSTAKKTLFTGL